jgi:hypothetical protein
MNEVPLMRAAPAASSDLLLRLELSTAQAQDERGAVDESGTSGLLAGRSTLTHESWHEVAAQLIRSVNASSGKEET